MNTHTHGAQEPITDASGNTVAYRCVECTEVLRYVDSCPTCGGDGYPAHGGACSVACQKAEERDKRRRVLARRTDFHARELVLRGVELDIPTSTDAMTRARR